MFFKFAPEFWSRALFPEKSSFFVQRFGACNTLMLIKINDRLWLKYERGKIISYTKIWTAGLYKQKPMCNAVFYFLKLPLFPVDLMIYFGVRTKHPIHADLFYIYFCQNMLSSTLFMWLNLGNQI